VSDLDRFVANDRFARLLGIHVTHVTAGSATAEVEVVEEHLNSAGTAHGGFIFSVADAAFSAASNSHGVLSVAIAANISYFKAVAGGKLQAEAKQISLNPKLATYSIDVTDGNGSLVARFEGTVYRKSMSVTEVLDLQGGRP
jgi:acyl-CoA thioesterase